MKKKIKQTLALLLSVMMVWLCGCFALAEDDQSSDDSLSSLGITTELVSIEPEFNYSIIEYEVVVPAGTASISLNPTPSNPNATISDISGTELDEDGETTVAITVTAENGNSYTYYLYVESEDGGAALAAARAAMPQTEPQTEAPEEAPAEPETEDSRYISVARETLEEAENTISALQTETTLYRDRSNLLMRIMYVLIGLCVILLFIVINLFLRNRDIRTELNDYRGLDYSADQSRKGGILNNYFRGRGRNEEPDSADGGEQGEEFLPDEDGWEEDYPEDEYWDEEDSGDDYQDDLYDRTGRDSFYRDDSHAEPVIEDDPSTVPKPSAAKKQTKRMPKYDTTPKNHASDEKDSDDKVDVEYVDL